jgi:hypothetical protein
MASKRHIRRKSCGDKVRHRSEAAAMAESRRLYKKHGGFIQAYKCKHCGSWHCGHWRTGTK